MGWSEEVKTKVVQDIAQIRMRNLQVAAAAAAEAGAEPGSDEQIEFLKEGEAVSSQAIGGYFMCAATFFGDDSFEMDASEVYARATSVINKYLSGEIPSSPDTTVLEENPKAHLSLVP
jgi:hypothetical protein